MSDDVFLRTWQLRWHASWVANRRSHQIAINFDPEFPTIIADERRLTQVLNNLISNAIKYSPDGDSYESKARCISGM